MTRWTSRTTRRPARSTSLRRAPPGGAPADGPSPSSRAAGGGQVRIEVWGGADTARLLVLPAGVRVRNGNAARRPDGARYRIIVSAHARTVRVVVGTDTGATLGRTRLTAGVRLPLARPAQSRRRPQTRRPQ